MIHGLLTDSESTWQDLRDGHGRTKETSRLSTNTHLSPTSQLEQFLHGPWLSSLEDGLRELKAESLHTPFRDSSLISLTQILQLTLREPSEETSILLASLEDSYLPTLQLIEEQALTLGTQDPISSHSPQWFLRKTWMSQREQPTKPITSPTEIRPTSKRRSKDHGTDSSTLSMAITLSTETHLLELTKKTYTILATTTTLQLAQTTSDTT